ncbi:MAG: hypothetical protein ACTSUE_01995 [Promethearchaeota archaeon]
MAKVEKETKSDVKEQCKLSKSTPKSENVTTDKTQQKSVKKFKYTPEKGTKICLSAEKKWESIRRKATTALNKKLKLLEKRRLEVQKQHENSVASVKSAALVELELEMQYHINQTVSTKAWESKKDQQHMKEALKLSSSSWSTTL